LQYTFLEPLNFVGLSFEETSNSDSLGPDSFATRGLRLGPRVAEPCSQFLQFVLAMGVSALEDPESPLKLLFRERLPANRTTVVSREDNPPSARKSSAGI